jgi:HEAT repeat protein
MLAALLLISLQDDPARQALDLVEKLRSDSVEERIEAEAKLRAMGKAARPALEKAQDDRDPEVVGRVRTLTRLLDLEGKIPESLRKAVPGIEERLAAGDDHTWTEVFLEIARPCTPEGADLLARRKEDFSTLAVLALRGAHGDREKIRVLQHVSGRRLRGLGSELVPLLSDPALRAAAQQALLRTEARDVIPDLVRLLKGGPTETRLAAITTLAGLGAKAAAAEIAALASDDDAAIRSAAAEALGTLGIADSIPALVKLLADPDRKVRWAALRSLRLMGAREALPHIARLARGGRDPAITPDAVETLVELGGAAAGQDLLYLLANDDPIARAAALDGLAKLEMKDAAPLIVRALRDPDPRPRAAAAEALVTLGARDAVPAILAILEHRDPSARASAARCLGLLGAVAAVKPLEARRRDPDPDVRRAAAESLCRLGSTQAVAEFLDAAQHDTRTRLDALNPFRAPKMLEDLSRMKVGKDALEFTSFASELDRAWDVKLDVTSLNGVDAEAAWPTVARRAWARASAPSVIDVLRVVADDLGCQWVCSPGVIRILDHADALRELSSGWTDVEKRQ